MIIIIILSLLVVFFLITHMSTIITYGKLLTKEDQIKCKQWIEEENYKWVNSLNHDIICIGYGMSYACRHNGDPFSKWYITKNSFNKRVPRNSELHKFIEATYKELIKNITNKSMF